MICEFVYYMICKCEYDLWFHDFLTGEKIIPHGDTQQQLHLQILWPFYLYTILLRLPRHFGALSSHSSNTGRTVHISARHPKNAALSPNTNVIHREQHSDAAASAVVNKAANVLDLEVLIIHELNDHTTLNNGAIKHYNARLTLSSAIVLSKQEKCGHGNSGR